MSNQSPQQEHKTARWAALGGAILLTVALPIAIDQGYIRYNAYALPILGLFAGCLYIGFVLFHPRVIKQMEARKRLAAILVLILIVGIGVLFRVVLMKSKQHVAEMIRHDQQEASRKPEQTTPSNQSRASLAASTATPLPSPTRVMPISKLKRVRQANQLNLAFKESSFLTNEIKGNITSDFSRFRDYLNDLGINTPSELPPIEIGLGTEQGATLYGAMPTYRSSLLIGAKLLNDRSAVTAVYSRFVIGRLLFMFYKTPYDSLKGLQAEISFFSYYNWSFWNKKPANLQAVWASPLWDIRRKFGAPFTDSLVAYTLRAMIDTPNEFTDKSFDVYFLKNLEVADSVVESGKEKWPMILDIVKSSYICTLATKPAQERPEFCSSKDNQ